MLCFLLLGVVETRTPRRAAPFTPQVRTRLVGGDLRRPIGSLQAASAEQAAVLTRLAAEQEALRGQLRDTQALLAALQVSVCV